MLDSGASFHATGNAMKLRNFIEGDFGVVHLGDGTRCSIVGKGDVELNLHHGVVLRLTDVRYMPTLNHNLISVGQQS